jgi:hypothetical protein
VLSRGATTRDLSAAALGELTGKSVAWVAALRSWRLLEATAPAPAWDAGPVLGYLLVSATDLSAAQRLAATRPVGTGSSIAVLPVHEAVADEE